MYLDKHVELIKDWSKLKGETPLVTIIHGSQNYDLASEDSDVDSRTYFLPSLDNFIRDKKIFPAKINDEDKGILSLEDIRIFFKQLFYKNSFNTLELLFAAEYHFYNKNFHDFWYKEVKPWRYNIAYINPQNTIDSLMGMIYQHYKKIETTSEDEKVFWKRAAYVEYFAEVLFNYITQSKNNIFVSDQQKYLKDVKFHGEELFDSKQNFLAYLRGIINFTTAQIEVLKIDALKLDFDIDKFYLKLITFLKGETY